MGTASGKNNSVVTSHTLLSDMPSASNEDHDGRYYTEAETDAVFDAQLDPTGFDASSVPLRGEISFDDTGTNRDFSISVTGGETYFNFWVNGKEYRKTNTETLEISNVEGIHVVYYDEDETLKELVNPNEGQVYSGIRRTAFVTIIYWDAVAGEAIYVGEERHLNQMSGSTHAYLHVIEGLRYISGLGLNSIIDRKSVV